MKTIMIGSIFLSAACLLCAKPIRPVGPYAPSAPPMPIELGGKVISKVDPETAKPSADDLKIIADTVQKMNKESEAWDDQKLNQVVFQPHKNTTVEQDLYALSRREFFLVVDNSGSMLGTDKYPAKQDMLGLNNGQFRQDGLWSLYDSALRAAEGLFETVIALDADNTLDVVFLNPKDSNEVIKVQSIEQLQSAFKGHQPRGSTPMAEALIRLYNRSLSNLLRDEAPYITIVFTDGAPNDCDAVKRHLVDITRNTHISPDRLDTMAAYSFVQMGDDASATRFLQELDDELVPVYGATCDIADTKKDDFISGNQEDIDSNAQGPFKLIMDAIKD